jgi:hypothetical protein
MSRIKMKLSLNEGIDFAFHGFVYTPQVIVGSSLTNRKHEYCSTVYIRYFEIFLKAYFQFEF